MKVVLVLFSFIYFLYACSGDCLACHPVLKDKIDKPPHQLLKKCIECHIDDKSESMGSCGGDCFACHDKDKVINSMSIDSHKKLQNCKSCHFKADEVLNFSPKNGNFLMDEILKIK